MRHHGRLSRAARNPYPFITEVGGVFDNARHMFCIRTILRNGPRILRACATVAAELEAENEAAVLRCEEAEAYKTLLCGGW